MLGWVLYFLILSNRLSKTQQTIWNISNYNLSPQLYQPTPVPKPNDILDVQISWSEIYIVVPPWNPLHENIIPKHKVLNKGKDVCMTLCLWKMWYCKKMLSLPASLHPLLHFWCAERSTLLSTKKKIRYRTGNIIVWFNVMSQTSSLNMKREAWSNFRNSEKMIFLQISCSQNVHNVASSNKKRNRKKKHISTQSGCLKWYIDKIHSISNASGTFPVSWKVIWIDTELRAISWGRDWYSWIWKTTKHPIQWKQPLTLMLTGRYIYSPSHRSPIAIS